MIPAPALHLVALACGFVLDALFGDPYCMPHIIRLIGSLISWLERMLRSACGESPQGLRFAGGLLVVLVLGISGVCAMLALRLAYGISVGADIEYADDITLFRALQGRRDV